MTDDLEQARQRRKQRRAGRPAGASRRAKAGKAVIGSVMTRAEAAEERRDPDAYFAARTPTPERMTMALDMGGLYGPEVDRVLGGEEPMVDEWESGARIPDLSQVKALAALTLFPLKFFYLPAPPKITRGFMCCKNGCLPLGGDDGDCPTCGKPR